MPRAEQIAKPAEWDCPVAALLGRFVVVLATAASASLANYVEGSMRSVHRFSPARVRDVLTDHRHPQRRRALSRMAVALLATVSVSACTDSAIPTSPEAMAVSEDASTSSSRNERAARQETATLAWQARGRGFVIRSRSNPLNATRIYALLGVTQYAAAVAADGGDDDRDDRGKHESDRDQAQYERRRGAIAGASNALLANLADAAFTLPLAALAAAEKVSMAQQVAAEGIGSDGRTHPEYTRGVALGANVATATIARAGRDGFDATWDPARAYLASTPPVRWFQATSAVAGLPAPAGYQFAAMLPYFIRHANQFRPAAPPAFGSAEFVAARNYVRTIADGRTAEQTRIANFWNLNVGTPTAVGAWGEKAAAYIAERRIGDREAARIYALANAAALDAAIGCWDAKYTYLLIRPSQADIGIVLAQGIPAVPAPPRTPGSPAFPFGLPNHPSYPSGHSCLSGAAVTVLESFFPSKKRELEAGLAEAGMSRVYGGIHYTFDVAAGQALGREVGEWALRYDRKHGLLATLTRR
jgi:membrane-associated phospholipid phosphatase